MKQGKLSVAALVAAASLLAGHAAAAPDDAGPGCYGKAATIVGTDGPDALTGTLGSDVIAAGAGDDVVFGLSGNDLICGGPGSDLVDGGRNNDRVDGGPGDLDRAYGGLGDDRVSGGAGHADEVGGGLGIDLVTGGPGNDDYVHGDYGWDRMDGGPGSGDVASFATGIARGQATVLKGERAGVWASLRKKKARGDGKDRLFRFEGLTGSPFDDELIGDKRANRLSGGPGDDRILGGGGADVIDGGQGSDGCKGGAEKSDCGKQKAPNGSAYVEIEPAPGGGGGLAFAGGPGRDQLTIAYDEVNRVFSMTAGRGVSLGPGCYRSGADFHQAVCDPAGPSRWITIDMGTGDDRLRIEGPMGEVGYLRYAAGEGDDVVRGGPDGELIQSGGGSDRVYGGAGSDGLLGGMPGPTFLYGGPDGDLLAAGDGCAGGALVGGPGRDNASFAETGAHPGVLIISLPKRKAWIDVKKGCDPVRLDPSNEDIEGSFDDDVLVGDGRDNAMLGQPGQDVFYGGGGGDYVNALDGMRDFVIQCGRKGRPEGSAQVDANDPAAVSCERSTRGKHTPGLHAEH